MTEPTHPTFLTRSGERTLTAQAIEAATGNVEAAMIADTLDLTAQAVLSAAGMSHPAEQRATLAILWGVRVS